MEIDIKALESAIDDAINHPSELLGVCLTVKEAQAVLFLLKENEPQQAELRNATWYCPRCKNPVTMFDYGEFNKYCGFCGQRVIF